MTALVPAISAAYRWQLGEILCARRVAAACQMLLRAVIRSDAMEPKRTPGAAEGTEEDIDIALEANQQERQSKAQAAQAREEQRRMQEPGRTPGKAEGVDEESDR
jgi:hypothetical protein